VSVAKIYAEKVSGAWSDRPQLAKLLKRLDQGDVLIVTRLDRLARSTRDLLNILDAVGKAGEHRGRHVLPRARGWPGSDVRRATGRAALIRKLKVVNKNSCLDIALILLCKYRFQK
jgi:hypothetical protein